MTNKTVKAGLDAKALEAASKLDEHALGWAVAAYNSDVFSSDKVHTAHIVSSYLSALPHAGVSEEMVEVACVAYAEGLGMHLTMEGKMRLALSAALSSQQAEAVPVAHCEDDMPERIWAGDFNASGFGHCVAGPQGGLYAEYVRVDLASPIPADAGEPGIKARLDSYLAENAKQRWTGRHLGMEGASIYLDRHGDATITFAESDIQYDDTGPYIRLAAIEVIELNNYLSNVFPTTSPAKGGTEVYPADTVRVCPERDMRCPHGMGCPFVDGYACSDPVLRTSAPVGQQAKEGGE